MRLPRTTMAALGCALLAAAPIPAQKKKDKEPVTQVLQLPKELPGAVAGETRRLTFHTTPLSGKGLLSPQVRDALKALQHEDGAETALKIRAFVAGSADVRRVRDLISENFTSRKQPLPSLTLVRAGGLPLEGAQVVLEIIAEGRKEVNPHGLAFISPVMALSDSDPLGNVEPLVAKTLAGLRASLRAGGMEPADALRVSCFVSSLQDVTASRALLEKEYPHAALDFVQTNRAPGQALAACEAVARLRKPAQGPVQFLDADGQGRVAMIAAPQVVLTGSQDSFGYQDQDARLAFERLSKSLEQNGTSAKNIVYAHFYALSGRLANQVLRLEPEFMSKPAGTLLIFEGLPSMDGGFGVDAVAVK